MRKLIFSNQKGGVGKTTLTRELGNRLRNEIYAALHEGTAHEWA